MECIDGCTTGEYKTIQYSDYTFGCQTMAKRLGKNHTTAMAGCKQKWLKITTYRFDMQMICIRVKTKHKHIEDAEERKRTITQEYADFNEVYKCIINGRTHSPEPYVFDNNTSVLDGTRNKKRAMGAHTWNENPKENLQS
jgi:hypothetical protein